MDKPVFIGSDIYRHSRFGGKHPLAIPRVSLTIDLCRALDWLPDEQYVDSPVASTEQLVRFHDPTYVAAVRDCELKQKATDEQRETFGLGINGNPVFGEVFKRPATAVGASLHAIELLKEGGIVFSPAGGTHHGLRAKASGFCFFNDPVLAILSALDSGLERVAYLDIDAHHCDGVEIALANDPRVLICSIHEMDRWPRTGTQSDAMQRLFNLPVPQGFDDAAFDALVREQVLPEVADFDPELVIVQCGADALEHDPLSKLSLTNRSHASFIQSVMPVAPRLLVTGGGGYNPWTVARCWTRVWGVLNGHSPPAILSDAAEAVLRDVAWRHSKGRNPPESWFTSIAD